MSDSMAVPAPGGLPRMNEPAPDFRAVSTHGEITLADYRGRWVVLFSHPADFTPVCTTEFVAFCHLYAEFEAEGVQLIGVSVDSVYSHIAWIRNVEERFGVRIRYPVIADVDLRVSSAYGMVHPSVSDTAAVRCVFFIDPEGLLRAMVYYPPQIGRSIPEVLRLVRALKVNTEKGVSCPPDWQPGEPVIVPAPVTQDAAESREREGYQTIEWYLSMRTL